MGGVTSWAFSFWSFLLIKKQSKTKQTKTTANGSMLQTDLTGMLDLFDKDFKAKCGG